MCCAWKSESRAVLFAGVLCKPARNVSLPERCNKELEVTVKMFIVRSVSIQLANTDNRITMIISKAVVLRAVTASHGCPKPRNDERTSPRQQDCPRSKNGLNG